MAFAASTPFGAAAAPAATTTTTIAAAPTAAPQPSISKATKFLDLPPQIREMFEKLESHIQTERDLAETVRNSNTFATIRRISQAKEQLAAKVDGVKSLLDGDARAIEDLKGRVNNELRNTELIARHIDRMRDPQKARMASVAAQEATLDYFQRLTASFEDRVRQYRVLIEEIERNLESLDSSERFDPRAIGDIIRAQNESFMGLASKVAAVHDEIARQKSVWDRTASSSAKPLSDIASSMAKSIQQPPPQAAQPAAMMASAAPAMGATSAFGGGFGFGSTTSNKRK